MQQQKFAIAEEKELKWSGSDRKIEISTTKYGVHISLSSRWQKIKTTTITPPYSKEKQTTLCLQYVVISKNAYLKILIEIGFFNEAV